MGSGKRILSGILAVMMVLSTAQFPGNISYAQEQPPAQESIVREGTDVQEDHEPGVDSGNEPSGEDSVMQPGTDKPEDASGESEKRMIRRRQRHLQKESPLGSSRLRKEKTRKYPESRRPRMGRMRKYPEKRYPRTERAKRHRRTKRRTKTESRLRRFQRMM